jgi:hypothetical protein
MDLVYFSLFFAALAIGYLLVHVRLLRFERYLQELAGLRALNDRTKAISDAVERLRVGRIEDRLEQIAATAQSLAEAVGRIERLLPEPSGPPLPVVPGAPPTPAQQVRALIESRLAALGYSNLRLLTDLTRAGIEETLEVVVECDRQQMLQKGKVVVHQGAIQDVQIQSAAAMFP